MTEDRIPEQETLRDRFAAAALVGILASTRHLEAIALRGQTGVKSQTQLAYRFADAMLEERKKK